MAFAQWIEKDRQHPRQAAILLPVECSMSSLCTRPKTIRQGKHGHLLREWLKTIICSPEFLRILARASQAALDSTQRPAREGFQHLYRKDVETCAVLSQTPAMSVIPVTPKRHLQTRAPGSRSNAVPGFTRALPCHLPAGERRCGPATGSCLPASPPRSSRSLWPRCRCP